MYTQIHVYQYTDRVPALPEPCCELWVIYQGSIGTHEDGILLCTPAMNELARMAIGEPMLLAPIRGEETISRLCPFEHDIWTMMCMKSDKSAIEKVAFLLVDMLRDLNACISKF